MKTRLWLVAVALLAVVLCGSLALSYAQQAEAAPATGWHGHGHNHMAWMARELNLTDAQKQQIKSMMQAQRTTMRPLMQQLGQNRVAMLTATSGGAFNQAQVTALATQQAQLMAQMIVQKQSIQNQIYTQVLTPAQRATADSMRQKQIARITEHLQKMSQSGTETPGQ